MELIGKQIAIETILGQPPELHYPSWYAAQIEKLPPAPPEYLAEQAGILVTNADTISRAKAIDAVDATWWNARGIRKTIQELPSAQLESCEYYALCRHGRDENKLREDLGFCEYCNEDADGYVKPIEKNNHAFVRFGMNGWEISLSAKGWNGSAKIRYCPMCGRDLYVK